MPRNTDTRGIGGSSGTSFCRSRGQDGINDLGLAPSGGSHHFFLAPSGSNYRNTQGQLAPKVDTRSGGGYVVAPPSSLESGGGYLMSPDCGLDEIGPAPQWLLDRLEDKPQSDSVRAKEPNLNNDTIDSGNRNGTLARMAGARTS